MDPILRREIMLNHYQNPAGKGLIEDDGYVKINTNNESCIDDLDIMYKIVDGIIQDIRFDGDACAISISATSIMISSLIGKNKEEAIKILEEYERMLNEEKYDDKVLGELTVYDEIYKQPSRKKCAFLPFETLKKILKQM